MKSTFRPRPARYTQRSSVIPVCAPVLRAFDFLTRPNHLRRLSPLSQDFNLCIWFLS